MESEDSPLTTWGGGAVARAQLNRGVVLRESGPWSQSVLALLGHLEAVGFRGAPRIVGDGFSADGREAVTYIPGTSPHPHAWEDHALTTIGSLLREMHEATASFKPPSDAQWKPWFGRALGGSKPVIGHCDTGPWNIVAEAGTPIAFIDWEYAGPIDGIWELAQTAWLNAQLHDDDIAESLQLPSPEARAQQVLLLLEAYGLPSDQRAAFVETLIEIAILSARNEAVHHNVQPDSANAIDASGYPVMWGIAWRARSAGWMVRHRRMLERSLG